MQAILQVVHATSQVSDNEVVELVSPDPVELVAAVPASDSPEVDAVVLAEVASVVFATWRSCKHPVNETSYEKGNAKIPPMKHR